MALRRLLSGWLIAVAAWARAVAEALERASEDRSASAMDPAMAALAERYPGAPAHWLAHVAQRTAELADAGQVPLSLNSDPSAWPPARPDGSVTPAEPPSVPLQPRSPAPARPDPVVPTLAALKDRSSEVWRRPDLEPRRRPRPVFATAPERSTRETTPETATPAPRPSSPLALAEARPVQAASTAPTFTSETKVREAPVETPGAADVRPGLSRPTFELDARALAHEAPRDRPEPVLDRAEAGARGRRPWFFEAPARARRILERSTTPADRIGPAPVEPPMTPDAAAVRPARIFGNAFRAPSERVVADGRGVADVRPPGRRSIFETFVSPRSRSRRQVVRAPTVDPIAPSTTAPPEGRPLSNVSGARATPFVTPRFDRPMTPRPAFTPVDRPAPTSAVEVPRHAGAARHPVRDFSNALPPSGARDRDRRSSFPTLLPAASREASHHAVPPRDDRWPTLPPSAFAPPPAVEAPPPRWDQLAREQEEGRWSV